MPKRGAAALTLTGLGLALLLNFRTPSAPATVADGGNGGTSNDSGRSTAGSGSGSTGSSNAYDGSVVDTRYGPVQVEVSVANGKVTDVTALELPNQDRRSANISSRAEPLLRSEALSAQSATIDGVSGATYTSDGYAQSLQSALDAAGL